METKQPLPDLLRSFSPLDGLKPENLSLLARKTALRELRAGHMLFNEGDDDRLNYYLVSGVLELVRGGRRLMLLRGGSPEARNPIAPLLPRRCGARVISERIEYLCIDSDAIDLMLTWDQAGAYEVSELRRQDTPAGEDWMTTLLQTKAFQRIPPANIQAVFMRMQRVNYGPGEVVIRQGDPGDYFYVVVKGRCLVTRETPLNKDGIKLAELGMGDSFGEEALISEAKRNATVTMLTAGTLMRLDKADFRTLLKEPMLEWLDMEQAQARVAAGGVWLDVRLPSEFESRRIEGAVNLPLYLIRLKLKSLDPETQYVVYCDTGRRSSAATYILAERGFHAAVLKGGFPAEEPPAAPAVD